MMINKNLVGERGATIASSKLGISLEEYYDCINHNERWCGKCKKWLPKVEFRQSLRRSVGVIGYCRDCFKTYDRNRKRQQKCL